MAGNRKTSSEMKVSTAAAVLAIVAIILFAVLSRDGENSSGGVLTYVTLAVGIVLQAVTMVLHTRMEEMPMVLTALRFLQTVCYSLALANMLLERINWLFRIMSKMSASPLTALFPAVIAVIALTIIVHVVSTYLSYEARA
ncbi:MAG: hypothetical protein LUC87_06305 [Clostridiales bacterium]|nr:hypothetical protein [Clostridiales bacterium]MCD8366619.1 hypothetical protein [Clostridiales bacterium]